MKKYLIAVLMTLALGLAPQAMAVTFPSADPHTLVTPDKNGIVAVKAIGESSWILVQYCQDDMRAGCANNIIIKPSEDSGGTMKFQLDMEGVADGQVAFNFRKTSISGDPWLAIPDCRVKTAGLAGMGMSYKSNDIAESGGAHFVFTGTPIKIWSPVASGEWCDEQVAVAPVAQSAQRVRVTFASPAMPTPVKVTDGAMGQSVVRSPDSQNVQVKQTGSVASVKGNHNTTITRTRQNQSTITNKGATVRIKNGSNNTVHACTYNINIVNVGDNRVPSAKNCGSCHNSVVWESVKNLPSCASGNCNQTATVNGKK